MKLHTNLTENEIRQALARAQEAGEVPADIEFDLFNPAGSRSHQHAWEVHLATRQLRNPATGKARPVAAYYSVHGQLRAASYDEWGWFLAEFFRADPDAHAGPYKGEAGFHRKTRGAYSDGHEDCHADPQLSEPEPAYASTEPTTGAMLPDAGRTLSRIDDALAYWAPNHP